MTVVFITMLALILVFILTFILPFLPTESLTDEGE